MQIQNSDPKLLDQEAKLPFWNLDKWGKDFSLVIFFLFSDTIYDNIITHI